MLPVVPSGFVVDAAELSGHVLRQAPAARAPGVFAHGLPTLDLEKMATPNKTTYVYEYVYIIYIYIWHCHSIFTNEMYRWCNYIHCTSYNYTYACIEYIYIYKSCQWLHYNIYIYNDVCVRVHLYTIRYYTVHGSWAVQLSALVNGFQNICCWILGHCRSPNKNEPTWFKCFEHDGTQPIGCPQPSAHAFSSGQDLGRVRQPLADFTLW